MITMFDGPLDVHYGYFSVAPPDEFVDNLADARAGQANGLLGGREPHRLSGVTGLHTGEVTFRVEWSPEEPALDTAGQDVVEVSVDLAGPGAELRTFNESWPLTFPGQGWHRARFTAREMDAGRDLDTAFEEPAPDSYLLQLWPAPPAPDAVVARHSAIADYWHGVAGGAR
ncbi:hypothetical protein [Isoptericola sp. NPDC019482]|uniref:hypothetical protein n=1 Tax=Isoptericola sp. NPDC019482 TaxID=3154688 RepID=UPI0034900A81